MKKFEGKIALVTGASRGIGAAVACDLASCGAHVLVNFHKNQEGAHQTLTTIEQAGGQAEIVQASVANQEEVQSLFNHIRKTHRRLDFVVNNAGVMRDKFLAMMSTADWQEVIETNLGGLFLCSRQAIKLMIAQRSGSIVNLSSLSGMSGRAGQCNYASSKAGVIAFTRSLAVEAAQFGVRVNCVVPGCIETNMFMSVPNEQRQELIDRIPMKKMGHPEDIAAAIRFLLSEDASYIQGHVLVVDGGLSCQ